MKILIIRGENDPKFPTLTSAQGFSLALAVAKAVEKHMFYELTSVRHCHSTTEDIGLFATYEERIY